MSLQPSTTDQILELYREYMDDTWDLLSQEQKVFWDKRLSEVDE